MNEFQTILWVILSVYVAGMLVLGFFLRKRARGLAGFLVARRKLPILFTTLSLSASIIGASMTYVAVGMVFLNGLSGMWFTLGPAFFLFLMGLFIAKKVRKTKALTLSDLIGKMFDTKTRVASGVLIVITEIAWISLLAQTTQVMLVVFLELPDGHWSRENRPHLNITFKGRLGTFDFSDRSRFEYRETEHIDDRWRYVNRFEINFPLELTQCKFRPYIADQVYINMDGSGFEKNRIYAGVTFDLSEELESELYYVRQWSKSLGHWKELNALGFQLKIFF